MSTAAITAPAVKSEILCPVHLIRLTHLLRGNIGHCSSCGLFVEPLNHTSIPLDERVAAKREAEVEAQRLKAEAKAAAKPAKRKKAA